MKKSSLCPRDEAAGDISLEVAAAVVAAANEAIAGADAAESGVRLKTRAAISWPPHRTLPHTPRLDLRAAHFYRLEFMAFDGLGLKKKLISNNVLW